MFWYIDIAVVFLLAFLYLVWKMIAGITKIFLDLRIQLPYEEKQDLPGRRVVFETPDGITLPGLFIRSEKSDGRTVIFCPEFGADLSNYQKYAAHLVDAGYHLFVFEFRGHGPVKVSEGYIPTHWPTRFELNDLYGAIDFVCGQKGVAPDKVALFGVSKGGCIAICAAGSGKREVAAVITDSAFSTKSTALLYMERWGPIFLRSELFWKFVPRWFLKGLQWVSLIISGMIHGCRFISVSDYLKKWPGIPLFLIHGERDNFIPCRQAEELRDYVSNGEVEVWIVPKARHNESAIVEPEEYQRRTVGFLDRHIPPNGTA